jgi:hypothetical protein
LASNALAILIFILPAENGQYELEIDIYVEAHLTKAKKALSPWAAATRRSLDLVG